MALDDAYGQVSHIEKVDEQTPFVCRRWPGLNITSQLPSQHILFPLVVHVVVCSPCLALLPVMLMLLQVISFSRAAHTKRGSKERDQKSSEGSDSDYRMLQKYYLVTMFKIFLRPCRGRLWLMRASTCRSHTLTHTNTHLPAYDRDTHVTRVFPLAGEGR